ncbi:RNA-directed DNA polymerase from mobile element jockey-like, partial [Clonorchis sinensis]
LVDSGLWSRKDSQSMLKSPEVLHSSHQGSPNPTTKRAENNGNTTERRPANQPTKLMNINHQLAGVHMVAVSVIVAYLDLPVRLWIDPTDTNLVPMVDSDLKIGTSVQMNSTLVGHLIQTEDPISSEDRTNRDYESDCTDLVDGLPATQTSLIHHINRVMQGILIRNHLPTDRGVAQLESPHTDDALNQIGQMCQRSSNWFEDDSKPVSGKHEALVQPSSEMTLHQESVDYCTSFSHLKNRLSYNLTFNCELRVRVAKASEDYDKLEKMWRNQSLLMENKMHTYKAMVLSVLLYGGEALGIYRRNLPYMGSFHILGAYWNERRSSDRLRMEA